MARSIIGGLIKTGFPASNILVSDVDSTVTQSLQQELGIRVTNSNIEAAQNADVLVLAVKPNMMKDVCEQFAHVQDIQTKLFISVAAGVSVQSLSTYIGADNIVRSMPNTPALVGLGMTGLYAPQCVSEQDRAFAAQMLQGVGKTLWVEQENQINHVTAASGSSPAYFFLFMESMVEKCEALGFDPEQARLLVSQTATGAAELVRTQKSTISTLRKKVTSKGGTTAEALRVFEERNIRGIVDAAMQACIDRAATMAKQF